MTIKTTTRLLLGLVSAIILFHLCILAKIIPYEITWGGRLQNDSEMYVFETLSIFINLFLVFVLLIKVGQIKPYIKESIVTLILWIFFMLFVLNTIGNIFAKTIFEKSFAVVTLLFAFLIWRILKNKESTITKNDQRNTNNGNAAI